MQQRRKASLSDSPSNRLARYHIRFRIWPRLMPAVIAAMALVLPAILSPKVKAARGPAVLNSLTGYWTGQGQLFPTNGVAEKIRCRVAYTGQTNRIRQFVNCAGIDYQFQLAANLKISGTRISGNWSEKMFNARGVASGTALGNKITVSISGAKFSGEMVISLSGLNRQTIAIRKDGRRVALIYLKKSHRH